MTFSLQLYPLRLSSETCRDQAQPPITMEWSSLSTFDMQWRPVSPEYPLSSFSMPSNSLNSIGGPNQTLQTNGAACLGDAVLCRHHELQGKLSVCSFTPTDSSEH